MKALRLFDYNRDGQIQKHELRRVMENFCFRLTDEQFNRYAFGFLRIFVVLTIMSVFGTNNPLILGCNIFSIEPLYLTLH